MKTINTEGWNKFSDNQKPEYGRQILVDTEHKAWPYEILVYVGNNETPWKWDKWKYLD